MEKTCGKERRASRPFGQPDKNRMKRGALQTPKEQGRRRNTLPISWMEGRGRQKKNGQSVLKI